jgi:hypothetical protein
MVSTVTLHQSTSSKSTSGVLLNLVTKEQVTANPPLFWNPQTVTKTSYQQEVVIGFRIKPTLEFNALLCC